MKKQTVTRKPTIDNPYMNRLIADPANEEVAENVEIPDIKRQMREMHDDGIPQNAIDIFGRNTSERTFYTMPVTDIVSDQGTFAKWLFRPNDGVTFKEKGVLYHR